MPVNFICIKPRSRLSVTVLWDKKTSHLFNKEIHQSDSSFSFQNLKAKISNIFGCVNKMWENQ